MVCLGLSLIVGNWVGLLGFELVCCGVGGVCLGLIWPVGN